MFVQGYKKIPAFFFIKYIDKSINQCYTIHIKLVN